MIGSLSSTTVGAGLATIAAVCFAVQFLCIRLGTDDGTVADAVLITLLCNVGIVVPLVVIIHGGAVWRLFTPTAVVAFAAAGVAGLCLARVSLFKSVEQIGASRTSPVVASNVLFATLFAYAFLGERVTPTHLLGIGLIVGGVALLSWETTSRGEANAGSWREQGVTLAYPIAAAVLIGIEPIFVTIGLAEGTTVLAGLAAMMLAGTLGFAGYWLASRTTLQVRGTDAALRWYLAAGLATTVGFTSYLLALETATVVVVMPILQTNPLLVLLLSALFLPTRLERISRRLVVAACVIVLGATIVSVVG